MKPPRTCSITQPRTPLYINDYLDHAVSETPTGVPTHPAPRLSTAIIALTIGLGLAILVLLGTWWSRSTSTADSVTTFVASPEEQPLPADGLEDINLLPRFLDDIFARF